MNTRAYTILRGYGTFYLFTYLLAYRLSWSEQTRRIVKLATYDRPIMTGRWVVYRDETQLWKKHILYGEIEPCKLWVSRTGASKLFATANVRLGVIYYRQHTNSAR